MKSLKQNCIVFAACFLCVHKFAQALLEKLCIVVYSNPPASLYIDTVISNHCRRHPPSPADVNAGLCWCGQEPPGEAEARDAGGSRARHVVAHRR